MAQLVKTIHQYTDEELKKEYNDILNGVQSVDEYYVLCKTWDDDTNDYKVYVLGFSNMLHALQHLSSKNYETAKIVLSDKQFQDWENAVNSIIATIQQKHNDKYADIDVLSFENDKRGFSILHSGFWDEFIPGTLLLFYFNASSNMIYSMHHKIDTEIELSDDDIAVADKEIMELEKLSDKIELMQKDNVDIYSAEFMSEFIELCTVFCE